ncbi:MAG: BA14K family protein [Mesorhizobium sp.]
MFKTPKAIGWMCAAVGAVMLAGTATASARDGYGRYGGHLEGTPGCMLGSTDCWIGSGPSYRYHDYDYRRHDYHHAPRYKYRRSGPNVGIYLGVPSYRYVQPRYVQPRITLSRAHVNWCHNRYRSYRAWDNTFQPYNGPRRQCWSPYS